ncbi:MAG: 3-hydroxyacyl-ACP dehydratase FabZ family protein [candidate division FCPU426 bacterium]
MDSETILKSLRKKPLAPPDLLTQGWSCDQAAIRRILPHREPFLLLDRLIGLDLDQAVLAASRRIDPGDPVLRGHFPGLPVYPGALQVEMIGQAGLCLYSFLERQSREIAAEPRPLKVRATKILGAHFLESVLPGQEVMVVVKKLAQDPYLASVQGQVIYAGRICAAALCEVCFLE